MRIVLGYEHIQRLLGAHSHVVVELARGLQRRGHDVTIVCDTVTDPDMFPDLHFVARRAWKDGESHRLTLLRHWAGPTIDALSPDVSVSFHPAVPGDHVVPTFGWIATRLQREHEFLGNWPRHIGLKFHPNIIERRYVEWRTRRSRRLRSLIALSRPMREVLLAEHPSLSDRVVLVPGASPFQAPTARADLDRLRSQARSLLGIAEDEQIVLWAGRIGLNHGLGLAMRAFARVAEAIEKRRDLRPGTVRMIVAGNGMWGPHDRGAALGCPERFIQVGRTREMELLLAACDLGILPSIHSLYGRFVWECLAFGRPVIASTRTGGTDRMQSAASGQIAGRIIQPADLHVLSDALLNLLGDADAMHNATEAAREIAPSMQFDQFVDRMQQVLTQCEAGASPSQPASRGDREHG